MKYFLFLSIFVCSLFGSNLENNNTFPFEMAKSPLESINMFQYAGVIFVLVGLLLLLLFVKRKINNQSSIGLFKSKFKEGDVKVISNTQFGLGNRLLVFEVYGIRYLVTFSQNNMLLIDKYAIQDFDDLLNKENEK